MVRQSVRTAMHFMTAVLLVTLTACTGAIGDPGETVPGAGDGMNNGGTNTNNGVGNNGVGNNGVGNNGVGNNGVGNNGGPAGPACSPDEIDPAPNPIRRLTAAEYENSVRDLFTPADVPSVTLVRDSFQDGFTNNEAAQSATALHMERFTAAAEQIGVAVAGDLRWASCSEETSACAQTIATELATRAYRRPLTGDETDAMTTFAGAAFTDHGFREAVEMVVEVVLSSPFFLYRPELGDGDDTPLDGYQLASRLSYFLWQTLPDEQLLEAAQNGELATDAGLEAHARRMLDDPRALESVRRFFREWLRLDKLEELDLDPEAYPEFSAELRDDLAASIEAYAEAMFWSADSWDELMSGQTGFVNDRLAPIYGVPAPGSDELVEIELDGDTRAGLLTQPGLLASTSHGITHSPIFRGVFTLTTIMCQPPPAPPAGILDMMDDREPSGDVCTTRDYFSRTHLESDCVGCHAQIDGVGYTFENYDALGRYRTEENGCDIDATSELAGTWDLDGEYDGAVGFVDRIADSQQVRRCVATHFLRYALGRSEQQQDFCQAELLGWSLGGHDSLQELVIEVVMSPTFRTRPAL